MPPLLHANTGESPSCPSQIQTLPFVQHSGMFSSKPPPVIWATVDVAAADDFEHLLPRRCGWVSAAHRREVFRRTPRRGRCRKVRCRRLSWRTRLKPLECTPDEAIPHQSSPTLTFEPSISFDFSTTWSCSRRCRIRRRHSRHLGGLAAHQRAAGLTASLGDSGHDGLQFSRDVRPIAT